MLLVPGIDLFWWLWRRYRVMRCTLPSAACLGLPLMPLDTSAGRVFATYCPGGCHGHRCCMWTNGQQNTNFSLPLTKKTNCWFLWWNEYLDDTIDKECSIQCEDLMILRFSNTKLSMLFKILSVGEAPRVQLDKLLDKTTVQSLSASRGLSACGTSLLDGRYGSIYLKSPNHHKPCFLSKFSKYYRRTRGKSLTGLSPFSRKCGSYICFTSHFSSIPTHVHHLNAIFLFSWTRAFQRCVEPPYLLQQCSFA